MTQAGQAPPSAVAEADADRRLVEAFRAGDRRAFEQLVRRHQRPVWAIAQRFARDRDAADDLAQRAFIQALERIGELRGGFRPWLLRIAVNLAKNHLRDNARLVREADAPLADEGHRPQLEGAIDLARQTVRVRRAIAELSERQREVVLLRTDGALSFAEVGEALGITENNAKVTYHHAVRRLRELLGDEGGGDAAV